MGLALPRQSDALQTGRRRRVVLQLHSRRSAATAPHRRANSFVKTRPASFPSSVPLPITAQEVFEQHASKIFSLAWRFLNNYADAEDVTQDVLLSVVRKLGQFRG